MTIEERAKELWEDLAAGEFVDPRNRIFIALQSERDDMREQAVQVAVSYSAYSAAKEIRALK